MALGKRLRRLDHQVFVFFDNIYVKYLIRVLPKRIGLITLLSLLLILGILLLRHAQVDHNLLSSSVAFLIVGFLIPRIFCLLLISNMIISLEIDEWEIALTQYSRFYLAGLIMLAVANPILFWRFHAVSVLLYDALAAGAVLFIYFRRVYDLDKCPPMQT